MTILINVIVGVLVVGCLAAIARAFVVHEDFEEYYNENK